MTAYQTMLAKQAKTLTSLVAANLEIPVVPLAIGLRTVLTGAEVALPSEDLAEVERRFRSIRAELKASGELEGFFARRVATMTVRVERSVRLESVQLAVKVRSAVTDFDSARFDEALRLYDWISAEPQANSRKLHETIEGVDRMIKAFTGLKDDLLHSTRVRWDWVHLEKVENLMGRRLGDLPISRAKALSEAVDGNFVYLDELDANELEGHQRRDWARARLAELIDVEIERLQAHRTTFDLDEVARERSSAVDRVLFDSSKEATQARKYESAAERSLYRALRELRKLQAEKAKPAFQEALDETSRGEPEPELGSFFPGENRADPSRSRPSENSGRNRSSVRPHDPSGTRNSPRTPST